MGNTSNTNMSRIVYLDVLRVMATFAVITIHVVAKEFYTDFPNTNWHITTFYDSLVRWAVPIFVMISGTIFLDPNRNITTIMIKRKFLRLLYCYLFWWLFIAFTQVIRFHLLKGVPLTWDLVAQHIEPLYHLWFLPMLMGLYLLIPILRHLVVNKNITRYFLILWFIFSTCQYLPFVKDILPRSSMHFVVGYSGYFVLGYYLSQLTLTKKQMRWIVLVGLAALFSTFAVVEGLSYHKHFPDSRGLEYLQPLVVLTSVSLYLIVKQHFNWGGGYRFVSMLTKDLFGIYLVHAWLLLYINKDILRNLTTHIITLPLLVVVTFLLSWAVVRLIRQIPIVKKIVE